MVIKNKWILLPITLLLASCSKGETSVAQKMEFLNEKNLQSYQTLKINTELEIDGEKLTGNYVTTKSANSYHVEYNYQQFNTIDLESDNQDYLVEKTGSFDYDAEMKNLLGDNANLNIYLLTLKDFSFKTDDFKTINLKANSVYAYVNDFAGLFHLNSEINESIINVEYDEKIEHIIFKNTSSKYVLSIYYSFIY